MNNSERMMKWLGESPCNFFAVKTVTDELDKAGFKRLSAADKWDLRPGGAYYMVKNDTAVFPFILGRGAVSEYGFRIVSSHSDSPCFKLKPNAEIYNDGGTVSLNVEKYGGAIMYTWFDRPLSMAGRVMLRTDNPLRPETRLVDFRKPLCTIPHLAIHFNRQVNDGNPLSVQKDMKPVLGRFSKEEIEAYKKRGGIIRSLLADELATDPGNILDWELALYPVEEPRRVSLCGDLFQSGRIDDLSMAFASLQTMLSIGRGEDAPMHTCVMALFDNEETGSGTKQGAASPVLADLLKRITETEGAPAESFARAVENSFMVSADNAHAWHPNYNEKYDPTNHPQVGGGPVVKINANCKYMTDSEGAAIFRALCEKAGVPCQYFVNHGDVAGGSTLGNILTSQIDLRGVDMGCAIWAMHSAAETASLKDYEDTVKVFECFMK